MRMLTVQGAISSLPDNQRPKVLVSSSAVGYYGASSTSSFTEDSPAGTDYLAEICKGEPGPTTLPMPHKPPLDSYT
jgi:NAD dependent epimerase/dehydratase family enzyme